MRLSDDVMPDTYRKRRKSNDSVQNKAFYFPSNLILVRKGQGCDGKDQTEEKEEEARILRPGRSSKRQGTIGILGR